MGLNADLRLREMTGAMKGTMSAAIAGLVLGMMGCQSESAVQRTSNELPSVASPAPLATTTNGPVRGRLQDSIYVFKGVRYGADTAATRFAAPAVPRPWTRPVDAVSYGASCPQTPLGNAGGLFTSWKPEPTPALSEDCLFLNVWTPGLDDAAKRPVMVWLHGGGFTSGDGSSLAYDGARLARRGDVVVVTLNHRLNVFGYLALGQYGAGYADSAVAGVLDMILALRWVQDNIAAFGGDPDTVMIFGESGGGAKVSTLMTTPAARGLFHRAVVQSGAMLRFPETEAAQTAAQQVVSNLGLDAERIDRIRSLPTKVIQQAFAGTSAATAPSIDGRTLTRHPFEPDAAAPGRAVPLMLGTNRTESSLFLGGADPDVFELDWGGVRARLARSYPGKDVDAIIAGYRQLQPDAGPVDVYFEATTDARWLAGHVTQAERKVQQGGAPVYLYLFDWDTPVAGGKWRSPHALEIGFVFDNVANSESMSGVGPEQQRVADIMADTWIAFARTGNPNNPQIPSWPAYDLQQRAVMVFNETPQVVNDARAAQRALFDDGQAYGNRYQR